MLADARGMPEGALIETDVCIVGAGPAGIALAVELASAGRHVALLESGGMEPEDAPQTYNQGTVVGGPYAGLKETRWRQVGGMSSRWNTWVQGRCFARFVPLDPWDFSAWPFTLTELLPWYERAQEFLGLGRFAYEGTDWGDAERPPLPLGNDPFVTRIYQFGAAEVLLHRWVSHVRAAPTIQLYHHATAVSLSFGRSGTRVREIGVAGAGRSRFQVRASAVVLAAGAIENARLLLASVGSGLAPNACIGTRFMEHPRDYSLVLEPGSGDLIDRMGFYDAHPASEGTVIGGRLGLTQNAVERERVPNASVTFLPRERTRRGLSSLLHRIRGRRAPAGYGWSAIPHASRTYDALRVVLNLEQSPSPNNRIRLGSDRDPRGVPLPVLEWTWSAAEQEGLERLRRLLADAISGSGLGTIRIDAGAPPDPNAHHHAGTTRMSAEPGAGVVDADCRVHGVENLFVAGASVFPSAGFANPVLTIVALALRLAARLSAPSPLSRRTA